MKTIKRAKNILLYPTSFWSVLNAYTMTQPTGIIILWEHEEKDKEKLSWTSPIPTLAPA